MSHTPGQWVAADASPMGQDGVRFGVYQYSSDGWEYTGQRIALVDTSEDDAHLIAAAPKMLAALKAARTWLGDPTEKTGPYYEARNEIITQIDEAIAKATTQ